MNDDDDDPLGAARGIYVAFLISGLFYAAVAIIWRVVTAWPLW